MAEVVVSAEAMVEAELMAQDMVVLVEATVAPKLVGALAVEVVSILQRLCRTLVVGWAITHRKQHTNMWAEGRENSVYFKFQQHPDQTTAFVSQFLFAWDFSCCCHFCTICSHQVPHSRLHCLPHHRHHRNL